MTDHDRRSGARAVTKTGNATSRPEFERSERRSVAERTALWRRRLFEGEAGLTRFVVDSRAGAHMHELLLVKQAIFEGLPTGDGEAEWKAAFFRAQALMEKFVVGHFGLSELAAWAASNSAVYAAVDSGSKHHAAVPLARLHDQAALYESETEWIESSEEYAEFAITHCAIWDYRELARARGVTITLTSPCEYCVPATAAMITGKGLIADHQLTGEPSGPGCVWTAARPGRRGPQRRTATGCQTGTPTGHRPPTEGNH